jgi:hypothetical protein
MPLVAEMLRGLTRYCRGTGLSRDQRREAETQGVPAYGYPATREYPRLRPLHRRLRELLYEVNVPGYEYQEVSKQHDGEGCPVVTAIRKYEGDVPGYGLQEV